MSQAGLAGAHAVAGSFAGGFVGIGGCTVLVVVRAVVVAGMGLGNSSGNSQRYGGRAADKLTTVHGISLWFVKRIRGTRRARAQI